MILKNIFMKSCQDTHDMENILIITHDFPGHGGRSYHIISLLGEYGYKPIIITNRNKSRHKIFYKNNFKYPIYKTVCLNKSPFRIFSKIFKMWNTAMFFERLFFIPDLYITWVPFLYHKCIKIIKYENIKIVMTISPPESVHLVGLLLKKYKGVKWISNFEDLWTTKKIVYKPTTKYHDKIIKYVENIIYKSSDHIIANTIRNKQVYINDFNISKGKISVITLGFSSDEMSEIKIKNNVTKNKYFVIGYMGYFDKPGFPWELFLNIIKCIITEYPNLNIKVNICGPISNALQTYINDNQLKEVVICLGMFDHKEAVSRMYNSNILLLLMYETSYSKSIVPQKLYHYIAMNKPIIGIAEEDGEVSDIIKNTRTGIVISSMHINYIKETILKYYYEWENNGFNILYPDINEINKYEYHIITQKLSNVIGSVLSK